MAHTPGAGFDAAHDGLNAEGNQLTGEALRVETGHTHGAAPRISSITAVNTKGQVAPAETGGTLVDNVSGMKIVLVNSTTADDNTRIVIALADTDNDADTDDTLNAGGFVLKITFDSDVYPESAAGTTANAAPTIAVDTGVFSGVTFVAAAKDATGVNLGSSFTLGTLTRVQTKGVGTDATTDDEYSKREFLAPVTISSDFGQTLTAAKLPVSLWLNVAVNQVYSLTQLNDANVVQGRGNAEYQTPNPFSLDGYKAGPPDHDTAGPDITNFVVVKDGSNLKFTVTFDESLGRTGILPSHLMITGGTLVAGTTDAPNPKDITANTVADNAAHMYQILVTPTGNLDNTEVTVKFVDGSVADLEGNHYREPTTNVKIGRYDTVNPTVNAVATGVVGTGTGAGGNGIAVGMVKLSITFSEELGTGNNTFTNGDIDRTNSNVLLTNTDPVLATTPAGNKTVYELTVTPVPANAAQVVIVIKERSVADVKGNTLEQDTIVAWTRSGPETGKPVVKITGPSGYIESGSGKTFMTTNAAGYIDSVSGGTITITATDNEAVTNAVMDAEITVTGATKGKIANNMVKVTPSIAATTVTVTVAANAAMDAAGNGNDAVSATFNVGPIYTIPAGNGNANPAYLVITKTTGSTHRYLSDQPTIHTSPQQTNPPTPAANITVATWGNMPDLERLFNTGSGNGGTLNIKAAATHPKDDKGAPTNVGNVRITEVMWAIDEYKRGAANDAEADEQWIEIENPNATEVKFIIYARTGRDSAINTNDGQIDRIGNAYNGSPGNGQWNVPGNNGNSYTGTDFVSMWRRYHENNRGKGYANGTASGAWSASSNIYLTTATLNPNDGALYNHKGTPGRLQSVDLPNPSTRAGVTNIDSHHKVGDNANARHVVINEVANRDAANAKYEWIELKNVGSANVNLRNWMISVVRGTDDDKPMIQFPNNNNAQIGPGEVILLLASDPRHDDDHPIAVGKNVDISHPSDQVDGLGLVEGDNSNRQPPKQKVITFANGGLPDGGDYILILRREDNHEGHRSGGHGGKGVAETGKDDIDKIIDIAGSHRGLVKDNYPATTPANLNKTHLWPLVNFDAQMQPHYGHGDLNHRRHNRLEVNRVRYRQHVSTRAKNDADGGVNNRGGTGVTHKNEDVGHYAFRDAIYTGLGYKRTARIAGYNNGTPGYDGNSVGNTGVVKATATDAMVTISEIMYSTGPNPDNPILPQWIELYNSSPTNAVNLRNWKLRFEMLDADGNPMDSLMHLEFNKSRVKTILPQQTVLIVAGNARQANSDSATGGDVFNDNRVFNVFRDYGGANKFGANDRYQFFDQKAFYIGVLDKDGKVVDEVGNLDGDARTSDTNDWDFPAGVAMDGNRTSIIRVYDDADGLGGATGVARTGVNTTESNVMPVFGTGDKKMKGNDGIDEKWSWIPAVNTEREFKITIKSTWYGVEDDYGTPGNRPGMVLPVELSHFRPTLEDGTVTIRWTTESELDNAGFNILRSDTRNGEYKQVNAELIDGAGTTGERNTYKWVDQTAKPGVVYYYQIEDVSFAGERQALAITKLKGLISAKNKLTTTWSELKASQ